MIPNRVRTTVLLVVAVALSVAALAQPARAATRTESARLLHTRLMAAGRSLNWSGYIKAGKALTSSSASWHVPAVKTSTPGYSSTWVGIDGATSKDGYLIQTGTESDVVGGKAQYRAWWEVITPSNAAPETLYSNFTIHPGDSMHATVSKLASGKWSMTLRDYTTGRTATHTAAFAGTGASAEWIQEDTDVNGYVSTAPNWGTVTISGITVNGANPALTASQAVEIVDAKNTREDSVSAPGASHDGFSVTWLAAGTRTYVG
ncbi:G1 family glutamic endopeptidase [Jatrophihabitans sp.]|uniref:G1 family glutamic endopeptidase n=1 Tax=Jatrophihabitans sp. TaxID=1932789 RepID=UPI0030C70F92|nr:hypothetical protein [Jatrophihabitans sp.]